MKSILIFFAVLATFAITAIASIYYKQSPSTDIRIASDETEKEQTKPEWDKIFKTFNLQEDIWQSICVSHFTISDVHLTKIGKAYLPTENHLSNEINRRSHINAFNADCHNLATQIDTISSGKNFSSVYLPIALQLNSLSKSQAINRVAYLYSDLKENTPKLSLYNPATFKRLRAHPEELIEYFNTLCPLEDLKGVTVYLLHDPKDINDDTDYLFISGIYKTMLENAGATVIIQSGL